MFAFPTLTHYASSHDLPHFVEVVPASYEDLYTDFHAEQRRRQRRRALKELEAAEQRRRLQEELEAAAAYRAAIVADAERRHRQFVFARKQRRREDERRRLADARRLRHRRGPVHAFPNQLLDLVFQLESPAAPRYQHIEKPSGEDFSSEEDDEVIQLVPLGMDALVNVDNLGGEGADDASSASSDSELLSENDDRDFFEAESTSLSASADRDSALSTLASLSSDFAARRATFTPPTNLAFSPSPVPIDRAARSPTPPLAFGSGNAPFLGYEEALLALLTRIDAVESHGDRAVQQARKALVNEVEQELARLDGIKDRAWEEQSASSAGETDTDDESTDSDEESMEEDAEESDHDAAADVDVLTLSPETSDASDADSDSAVASFQERAFRRPGSVKVPYLPARHTRFVSPAPSSSPSDSENDDEPTSLNAGSDDVASALLEAHKLHDEIDEMSDDERERLEMGALRAADATAEPQDNVEEDGFWVYC